MKQDIQGHVFNDFDPPATTDGSYRGVKHHSDETNKHYQMKLEAKLVQVNQRLKDGKTKVSLEITGNAIQLRATLPIKPDDTSANGKNTKQYKISLGIPANFDGLKTAEEEAYELGRLIARKMFVWNDKYLGSQATKNQNITFREFYHQLESRYFEKRKRNMKSEHSFHSLRYSFHKSLINDEIINSENLRKSILSVDEPYTRNKTIRACDYICKELGLEFKFNDLKLKQVPKTRNIPSDRIIVESLSLLNDRIAKISRYGASTIPKNKAMQFIYKLLAIYGLRPREVINKPDLDWLMSLENKHNTFKVHESNKTGYREVFPFVPDWVELFDLKNDLDGCQALKFFCSWKNERQLTDKVSIVSKYFLASKLSFVPYDLRHACAIRAHLQGIPLKVSADNLGHTVDEHTKTYQRHFGLENRRLAFEQKFQEINQVETLKHENTRLRKEIAELKLEVARIKLETQI
ncbi:MAG: site-specific integrase [Rivularia sp. T60_A2020_040]|nr:site-specific integrase [Rivularia sp. T60_A2020_040]